MAELATDDITWNQWKGRMPVIYDKGLSSTQRPSVREPHHEPCNKQHERYEQQEDQ